MRTPELYQNAPTKIRVGRVLMVIASVLFFIISVAALFLFVVTLLPNSPAPTNWSDTSEVITTVSAPFLSVFYIVAGIGGICYVIDKHRIKVFASLASVIMMFVIVISTVLMFRNLIKGCLTPEISNTTAVINFVSEFVSIQLTGGIYFLGWFLIKDYTGD